MSNFIVPLQSVPYHIANTAAYTWASNTSLTVSPMQVRDTTNTIDIVLPASTTLLATGTGLNGLDTGSLGISTWYYLFLVADSSGKQKTGVILSLSQTAPLLPFGYDAIALVGFALTDGSSHFLKFYAVGNGGGHTYWLDTSISVLSGGASSTYAPVNLATAVPPLNFTEVVMHAGFVPNAAGDIFSVRPTGSTATAVATYAGAVAAKSHDFQMTVLAEISSGNPSIDYLVTASGALTLNVLGFKYNI
jgi:hypothetical protein